MSAMDIHRTLPRHGAIPSSPYVRRAPSPPSILIPAPTLRHASDYIKIVPSYDRVDPASLSASDLQIITQNYKEQLADDSAMNWSYENRRQAQPILDFLYLGPSNVLQNRQWLRDNGITMLLAARDSKMAVARLLSGDKVAQELGIQAAYVDVSGYEDLVRAFPAAIRTINDHMLSVFREQRINDVQGQVEDGQMAIPQQTFRRGKVLVFCETGNDRSAGVVAAYLMSVFGMTMVEACQFVQFKRFCTSLTDTLRFILRAFEEILIAQRTVHRHELESGSNQDKKLKLKRSLDDMLEHDQEMGEANEATKLDQDRFSGRQTFVPFVDVDADAEG
ncbi:phosphatases II [Hypomontagnella submonticulosa]|nr:phosphatases II [Hypomontagnella submonticulosa]